MAVTAVFQADFTSFDTAVKGADAQLRAFEGTSKTTEKSLQQMSAAASANVAPAQQIATSYKQFDGILASMGVNIGPQVKALQDLTTAAQSGAAAMGPLGLAVLAVIAIFKSYQWADEFFKLHPAVTEAIALIIGYGSASAETAAAVQDTLVLATKNAGREITNLTEAIKINEQAMKDHVAAGINWTGRLSAAQAEVRALSAAEKDGIAIAQAAGAKVEEITAKYHISALGLKVLADQKKVTSDQAENLARAHDKEAAAAAKLDAEYAKLNSSIENERGLAIMAADASALKTAQMIKLTPMFSGLVKATADQHAATAALAEQEKILAADYEATVVAAQNMGKAHTDAGAAATEATQATVAGYQQVGQQVQLTTDNVIALAIQMRDSAAANAILMENSLFTSASQYARIAALPLPAGVGRGGGGRSAPTVNNTFHLVDTQDNLARKVSSTIMGTIRSGTQLGTT